jgi:O-antigen/teichoic acid export membrane protein
MNSRIIAKNSFWFGVESFIGLVLTVFTSIAIVRTIGPVRLGYFIYLWWIAGVAGTVGSLGIPASTRKYMSEYFGRGQMGVVRTVFNKTLRAQAIFAAIVTLVGFVLIVVFVDREYRVIAFFMIGSIWPFLLNSIAAGANTALEDLRANVLPSLISTGIFVIAVCLSLYCGWNLLGIAIGLFTMRVGEALARILPLVRRLSTHVLEPLEGDLGKRMFLFSGQSVVLLGIGLVVWDRSEMVVLKNFCADIRQIAFYSVAFNITERLLAFSQVFGTATGTTIMVQYGRDASRLRELMGTTMRYLALISFPVHFGLAAIAGPTMWIIYGPKYAGAVPALAIAACLGIPKAFLLPVQALLSSCDRQDLIIRWGLASCAINVALDFTLIPKYGAVGAAIANGATQTFTALTLWVAASHLLKVRISLPPLVKTVLISAVMAIAVHVAVMSFRPVTAVIVGVAVGTVVYIACVRMARLLSHDDHGRMLGLKRHVPSKWSRIFEESLDWLIPRAASGALIGD